MEDLQLKPILGYDPVYYIDIEGNVYRNKHKMSPINNGTGYYQIKLTYNKKRYNRYIHSLVWETFMGKVPKGFELNHKDHNKRNNALSNLEVVTHSENLKKAVKFHGHFGFMNKFTSTLTPSQAEGTPSEGVETTGEVKSS